MTATITRADVERWGRYFVKKYPYLKTPDGAVNRCGEYSRHIVRCIWDLAKHPNVAKSRPKWLPALRKAHVLHMEKPRPKWPRRHIYHRRNPKIFNHCVVRVGDWTLDLTRRQIDPRCALPFVQHIDQVRRDWRSIKRVKVKA